MPFNKICPVCKSDFLTKYSTQTTCSHKCSNTLFVRKAPRKKYQCINCGSESFIKAQGANKYCSNKCQQDYLYKTKTVLDFNNGYIKQPKTLRSILVKERGGKCESCNIVSWHNKPLTFQLDHIDGDASNNSPTNLRLLCPNCHSQTETFAGKNRGKGRKSRGLFSTNIYTCSRSSTG